MKKFIPGVRFQIGGRRPILSYEIERRRGTDGESTVGIVRDVETKRIVTNIDVVPMEGIILWIGVPGLCCLSSELIPFTEIQIKK